MEYPFLWCNFHTVEVLYLPKSAATRLKRDAISTLIDCTMTVTPVIVPWFQLDSYETVEGARGRSTDFSSSSTVPISTLRFRRRL